jgi:hypothetical protein
MESLEYYQLKDTLGKELRDEIQSSISNERELQQKYIGLGIKIAIVGVSAAVVALGIFGIKSAYDLHATIASIPSRIDKRADRAVQDRFNSSENPITKYEDLLRDSAARAIAASISAQANTPGRANIVLDESTSASIVDCLTSGTTKPASKLSLISAMSTARIRTISPAIDQAVIAVLTSVSDAHLSDIRSLPRIMQYFSFRSPERFEDDIKKVYKAHDTQPDIQLQTAKYVYRLKKDFGQDLADSLAKGSNQTAKLLLHIRDLKNGTQDQLDAALITPAIDSALSQDNDRMSLDDLITYFQDVSDEGNNQTQVIGVFLDLLQSRVTTKALTFAAGNFLVDSDEFFGFADKDGNGPNLDRKNFDALFNMAVDHVVDLLKGSGGEFNEKARSSLAFWLPKALIGSSLSKKHVGFLVVDRTMDAHFTIGDGKELTIDQFGDPAIISVTSENDAIKVLLKWNDQTGKAVTNLIDRTSEPKALQAFGTWRSPTEDDIR